MRRLLFAAGTLGALILLTAHPASAVQAGEFCSGADSQAGTVVTADNGARVKCVKDTVGQSRWTAIDVITTTTAPSVTTPVAVAAASPASMAKTGLNHTRQFVEIAIVLLGLGTALVLEVRAREGLERLRQLPVPTRRSTRSEPHWSASSNAPDSRARRYSS